jgi:hypothetical protein
MLKGSTPSEFSGAKLRINERKASKKACFFCVLCRVPVTLMQSELLFLYYVISLQSFSLIAQNKAIAAQTKASGHKKSRNFALLRIACQPDT